MISKLQTLVYVLFATATLTSAALPPGYEDVLLCPKGYCLQRKVGRIPIGRRSTQYRCKSLFANKYVQTVAWGTRRVNAKAELADLVQREFHENPCGMHADENIGGGKVYAEYQKGPYTAGTEYNWDENDANENIGGGKVYAEYQKGPYTAGAEYNWDENAADKNIGSHYGDSTKASFNRYLQDYTDENIGSHHGDSTKAAFDKYLEDYVDEEPTSDTSSPSLDDSATASIAAAAKSPEKKTSANTKTQLTKVALWCGSGAFVALIIGGLIYRKVRSQRDQNYVDLDTSSFISKRERNYSIANSNQVYESPHVVNIVA